MRYCGVKHFVTEVHGIVQERGIKTIPKKKNCKKAKWLSEEALQIAVERREVKIKGERKDAGVQSWWIQGIQSRDGVGKERLIRNSKRD